MKTEGNSKSARIVSLNPRCREKLYPSIKMKERKKHKKRAKKRKSWNKYQENIKRNGIFRTIRGKWINRWLMSTNEDGKRRRKKVLSAPHIMRIKVTMTKWPYQYTQTLTCLQRPFYVDWIEMKVDCKIRAN